MRVLISKKKKKKKQFLDEVSEDCEYTVTVMVREFQRIVNVLAQNNTVLRINTKIAKESIDNAQQKATKLRVEIKNMTTYEAANTKIQEVLDVKDAEIKRRTNITIEEIKRRSNLAVERIKKPEEALKDS